MSLFFFVDYSNLKIVSLSSRRDCPSMFKGGAGIHCRSVLSGRAAEQQSKITQHGAQAKAAESPSSGNDGFKRSY